MATYNFEGDVSGISDHQLKFINNVIEKHGFIKSKVTIEPVGKPGDNYAASVKRIFVKGETGSLTMIAKITPTVGDDMRKHMSSLTFKNEHFMYTELLPKFVQLQKSAGVPDKDQLKYAKCYGSSMEPSHEVILLEDLTLLDFTMLDRFQPLSNECVKSILKNFAIYHSLSFVMKTKYPDTFEKFKASLINMWAIQSSAEEVYHFAKALEAEVISMLENPDHKRIVRISDYLKLVPRILKFENESKYSIIIQGDAWTNNILFKMIDGKVADSMMIDYQLSRYSSPVFDIMYMIFNCTDHETRKQYYYEWIDYYHSQLEKSLYNFDLKVNFVYARDKLDVDLKLYAKLIFATSIFLSSVLIRKSDDAEKLMESTKDMNMEEQIQQIVDFSSLDDETKALFMKRTNGLIDSFIEFGFL